MSHTKNPFTATDSGKRTLKDKQAAVRTCLYSIRCLLNLGVNCDASEAHHDDCQHRKRSNLLLDGSQAAINT